MQVQVQARETAALDSTIAAPTPIDSRWSIIRNWTPAWLRSVIRSKKALLGLFIFGFFVAIALLAPVISSGDPTKIQFRPHLAPSSDHWFGTTGNGQDVFDQTVWGARFTLKIGLIVGLTTTLVGMAIGMTAGYFRGAADEILSVIANVFLIIPSLPLLVVLGAFLGSGDNFYSRGKLFYFVLVLTITGWAWPARVIRSQTLALREKDFVFAALVTGERSWRIIFREILPNMLSIIFASFIGSSIFAIGAQAALEFLGLGDPGRVTWGTNLYWASNNAGLLTGAWWTFVPAGVCIALVAFSFALINYGIDEITNPRLRARHGIDQVLKARSIKASPGRATPVVLTGS
jgi:peptide/nickel transport system permease protein